MKLPEYVLPGVPQSLPLLEREWRVHLQKLREDLANDLYVISRRALTANTPSAAWKLVREAVWYFSDHSMARRILGFERFEDRWVTPFQKYKLQGRFVWHDQFGWIAAGNVERYENGERLFLTRWVSIDKEAELRRDFRNAWEVETDHYKVKTNVSLEKGVELANVLEEFHDWFQRTFPEFFNTPEQLGALFKQGARRGGIRKPLVIHFYRSKEEYVSHLQAQNPQIEITNGIYMPDDRVAHFYDNTEHNLAATLYHEATHQILDAIDNRPRQVGVNEHFWIVEGFACYIESLSRTADGFSIGDPTYSRFYWARKRLMDEAFFMPFSQIVALGKNDYQSPDAIHERYSQAAGMVHFLMHYQDGLYRDAMINHLSLLYRTVGPGRRVAGIDHFSGVSYQKLDQQYRDYISTLETE